jgi:hypothetical protein
MTEEFELTEDLDIAELFADVSGDDGDGTHGGGKRAGSLEPTRLEDEPLSRALALAPGGFGLSYRSDDDEDTLELRGTVENQAGFVVDLEALYATLRDADGQLVDFAEEWGITNKFSKRQELVHDFQLGPGSLSRSARVELAASYRIEFQVGLASCELEGVDIEGEQSHRKPVPLSVRTAPARAGLPEFAVRVSAFVGYRWDPFLEVIVELAERGTSRNVSREVAVGLRDAEGELIAKETGSLYTAGPDFWAIHKETFDLKRERLSQVRRIDVGVRGEYERSEVLGTFDISKE